MHQRGMSLIELVIAVAIVLVVAVAFFAPAQGGRAFGKQSAVQQFDAALAYAQSLAATSGNGATMVFTPRTAGGTSLPGFTLTVFSGRPNSGSGISASALAPVAATGDVYEAVLGAPAFTVFLDGAGHASGTSGAVSPGTVIAEDPGCPAGETSVTLAFRDSQGSTTRTIACNAAVAGAPIAIGSP